MQIPLNLVLLLVITSFIPAIVVAVVCILRQEALRTDIRALFTTVSHFDEGRRAVIERLEGCETTGREAINSSHDLHLQLDGVAESLRSLGNKWNARDAVEKRAARREEKERRENNADSVDDVPVEPDAILPDELRRAAGVAPDRNMFPIKQYVPNQQPDKPKRQFGKLA
jgi:hypothetical protein